MDRFLDIDIGEKRFFGAAQDLLPWAVGRYCTGKDTTLNAITLGTTTLKVGGNPMCYSDPLPSVIRYPGGVEVI